jgi:hypothetical protein
MARRIGRRDHESSKPAKDGESPWEARLEVIIAIALGLAAIVTAGSVYLNEHQEHRATRDFHTATHRLVGAAGAGLDTPRGRKLEALFEKANADAEDHQEKAAAYTLAEVILATSLFLFGIAGISARRRLKLATLATATFVFLVALVVLATV